VKVISDLGSWRRHDDDSGAYTGLTVTVYTAEVPEIVDWLL
jgi:hypothetical protein